MILIKMYPLNIGDYIQIYVANLKYTDKELSIEFGDIFTGLRITFNWWSKLPHTVLPPTVD